MERTSPFKFLDAYGKDDKDIFFGRDTEIEHLYDMVFESNLTLVYGQSGTGKTSLIRCGLANRFEQSDWFNVNIRRNENLNDSILATLKKYKIKEARQSMLEERLKKRRKAVVATGPINQPEKPEEEINELVGTLRQLYKHYLKPIYLIFDQFEELFILGDKAEQDAFYENIAQVLDTETYCRVIIVMREESIAELYDFEKIVPNLFDKRLRVEPMGRGKTEEVIVKTTEKFEIALGDDQVPEKVVDVLSGGEGQVELTYLQVFLDSLFQEAIAEGQGEIVFTTPLVNKLGTIEDVLGNFLQTQTDQIQDLLEQKYGNVPENAVSKTLDSFVTLEGTKRPTALAQVRAPKLKMGQIEFVVKNLDQSRILRYENELYELSHDALALQISEQRGADDVALLQIAKLIQDRYSAFQTTQTLLNNNELQLIKQFSNRLKEEQRVSNQEWEFVKDSIKANRRRKLRTRAIVLAAFSILTLFLVYTVIVNRQISEHERKLAEMGYTSFVKQGNANMSLYKYEDAIEAYELAIEFNPDRTEASDSIAVAKIRMGQQEQWERLMKEGNDILSREDKEHYIEARAKFQEAFDLNFNNKEAGIKLTEVSGLLNIAFEQFIEAGNTFYLAGRTNPNGYRMALKSYREAARIKPSDTDVQARINELVNKVP